MIKGRLFLLVFLILSPVITIRAQDYTSNNLTIDIFPDGSVNIDYRIEPDPTLARVNVSLIGNNYGDLLATDQDGIILDWDLIGEGIEVDSIGAEELTISYSSSSLTNKNGSTWTISIDSPAPTLYIIPSYAVLTGLDPTPSSIVFIDLRAAITMPQGSNTISYVLGTTGTKERAIVLLSQASRKIDEATQIGLEISSENNLFTQSTQAYETGSYSQSEQLSQQIIDQISISMILASESKNDNYTYLYALGSLIIIGVGGVLLYLRQKKDDKSPINDEAPHVDLDKVFKQKDHLRTDQKAVLRFIEESNGAFITDVRERFDIPKSSAWRMVKRLEEEGVVIVSKVGRETYLQLREPEGLR